MNQYLLVSSPFIVGSFPSIDAAHQAIIARWKRNGFKTDFDVVDRFNEPGTIETIKDEDTGAPLFLCWRPA